MSTPMYDLPEHLRMGLTKDGQGPVLSEEDPDFDHYGCWCGTPGCEKWKINA